MTKQINIADEAKQQLIDLFEVAMNMENNGNDFRRGKGIGMQKGVEKTLLALGFKPVFDDDWNMIDIVNR